MNKNRNYNKISSYSNIILFYSMLKMQPWCELTLIILSENFNILKRPQAKYITR